MPQATRRIDLAAGVAATLARTASARGAPGAAPIRLFPDAAPREAVTPSPMAGTSDAPDEAPGSERLALGAPLRRAGSPRGTMP